MLPGLPSPEEFLLPPRIICPVKLRDPHTIIVAHFTTHFSLFYNSIAIENSPDCSRGQSNPNSLLQCSHRIFDRKHTSILQRSRQFIQLCGASHRFLEYHWLALVPWYFKVCWKLLKPTLYLSNIAISLSLFVTYLSISWSKVVSLCSAVRVKNLT